jgi:HSP20 family molecular chaperone IbpA
MFSSRFFDDRFDDMMGFGSVFDDPFFRGVDPFFHDFFAPESNWRTNKRSMPQRLQHQKQGRQQPGNQPNQGTVTVTGDNDQQQRGMVPWSGFNPFSSALKEVENTLARPARFNLEDKGQEFLLSCEMPGIRKEDVKLDLNNDILTVSGTTVEEKGEFPQSSTGTTGQEQTQGGSTEGKYPTDDSKGQEQTAQQSSQTGQTGQAAPRNYSRSVRSFTRSMRVPKDSINHEGITAKFDNGLLQVVLPKLEKPQEQTKRITVQ